VDNVGLQHFLFRLIALRYFCSFVVIFVSAVIHYTECSTINGTKFVLQLPNSPAGTLFGGFAAADTSSED